MIHFHPRQTHSHNYTKGGSSPTLIAEFLYLVAGRDERRATRGKRLEPTNAATDDHLLPLIQYSSLYHPSASSPSSAVTLYLFFIYTIISSLPCPLYIMLAILLVFLSLPLSSFCAQYFHLCAPPPLPSCSWAHVCSLASCIGNGARKE